ncbi:MAG: T9SS type A sorting domain-containing protein [Bacteroidota bacterium]
MKRALLLSTIISFFYFGLWGQTSLNPGDVVIAGYKSIGSSHQLILISYVELTPNTEIQITDQSYLPDAMSDCDSSVYINSNGFIVSNDDDAIATWINSTGNTLSTGVVIHITSTGGPISTNVGSISGEFGISGNGDQIFIFQGSEPDSDPCNLIFGLTTDNNGSGGWDGGGTCTGNASDLPPCLAAFHFNFATAANGNEAANGQYNCIAGGNNNPTKNQLLDINNWEFGTSPGDFDGNGNFTTCLSLPVELINFETKPSEKSILLVWETASEKNNKGFEIEWRSNGENRWTTLGFVPGCSNSSESKNYNFNHISPVHGTNYYRLIQIDSNGQVTLSNIISVTFQNKPLFYVYPNPVRSTLYFELPDDYIDAELIIRNPYGQVIWQNNTRLNQFSHINLKHFESGLYLVQISINGKIETANFLKI